MTHFATSCVILFLSLSAQFTDKNSSNRTRMCSRDRRSRLASFASRHPDFFNLYHPLLPLPATVPRSPRFSRCFTSYSPIRHGSYLDRHLSAFVACVPTTVPLRCNFATRTSSRLLLYSSRRNDEDKLTTSVKTIALES